MMSFSEYGKENIETYILVSDRDNTKDNWSGSRKSPIDFNSGIIRIFGLSIKI